MGGSRSYQLVFSHYQTDARVQAVSETMSIIRMVKLFGWENRMSERLKGKREEELKLIWKIKYLNCVSAMIGCVLRNFDSLRLISLLVSFSQL